MEEKKILIVDEMHPGLPDMLAEIGTTPIYAPQIQRDEIIQKLPDCFGIIIRSKTKVDEDLLSHAPKLKFVARAGSGVDGVDVQFLKKNKICLITAAEGNRDAVGEHTVGMMLALLNRFIPAHNEISNLIFRREANRGEELKGKTVGLIGYGNMGQAVAKRLFSFEAQVIYYDIKRIRTGNKYARPVTLEQLQKAADIISIHIPLTPQNRNFINSDFIKQCTQKPYIFNTARGEILNMKDLLEAIESGIVRGAGLDVFENERFQTLTIEQKNTLKALHNTGKVLFTPHVAGWTKESYLKINQVLTQKIKNLIWLREPLC
jgi:D-3-phosphoglycerate dehydrogenase